jgi:hypothetical protein
MECLPKEEEDGSKRYRRQFVDESFCRHTTSISAVAPVFPIRAMTRRSATPFPARHSSL